MAARQPSVAPQSTVSQARPTNMRQMELLSEECKRLCNPDFKTPFTSIEDAVERLLPYHLFGNVDSEDADVDETHDREGAGLVVSRHDAWQDLCLKKAWEFSDRAVELQKQIAEAETTFFGDARKRPEEEYLFEKWMHDDVQKRHDELKAALAPPPPPPVMQPAAAAFSFPAGMPGFAAAGGQQTMTNFNALQQLLQAGMQPRPANDVSAFWQTTPPPANAGPMINGLRPPGSI